MPPVLHEASADLKPRLSQPLWTLYELILLSTLFDRPQH